MAMDQTPREFTEEEALYYAAGSEAIRTGDVRGLAQLISGHPELLYVYAPRNLREIGGRPLFQHLSNWPGRWPRRLESAALLIAAGADIDYRGGDEYGETVLTEAVSCYDFSLTELLVEAGASPDGVGDDRRPMAEALFYNSPIAAKVLVDHGATIDLEFAAGLGRMDLMPAFFDAHGNLLPSAGTHHPPVAPVPIAENELLDQALAYAAISGQVETGAFLVDHGAGVNAKPSGFPHRVAIVDWGEGNDEFVQFLIQRGARPPEPDSGRNEEETTG